MLLPSRTASIFLSFLDLGDFHVADFLFLSDAHFARDPHLFGEADAIPVVVIDLDLFFL